MSNHEYTLEADAKEVELEGVPFPVQGAVRYEVANVFAKKVAQGDPGPDDHPINSTWIVSNNSGGGQIAEHNPAQDSGRFWWSTLDTTRPNALTLPPLTKEYLHPGGDPNLTPTILGDFQIGYVDYRLMIGWGDSLYQWESVTDTISLVDSMGVGAVNEGCQYQIVEGPYDGQIWFFIPCDGTYRTYYNGSISAPPEGLESDDAVHFCVWNEKLYRLSRYGRLWMTTDGISWSQVGIITDGSTPRRLVISWSRENESLLYVVTDSGIYSYDDTLDTLRRTELVFPRHPRQGKAAVQHGGEGMFISVGMGIHRMMGDTITSDQGLDRDHGLPDGYNGEIVSLASSYGKLYALVKGEALEGGNEYDNMTVTDEHNDRAIYFGNSINNNLVMCWNGRGWHYVWKQAGANANNIMVSQAENTYRVWWAANGKVFSQKLPRTFFNPRNTVPEEGMEFALEGVHETGWYNWGWAGQDKILKRVEMCARNMNDCCSITIRVKYDHDTEPWITLGSTNINDEVGFQVGPALTGVGTKGTSHERFKIQITIQRDPMHTDMYPTVEWFAVIGRKWMRPQRSWRFMVDLTHPYKGRGPKEMADWLDILAGVRQTDDPAEPFIRRGIVFVHQNERYIVDMVGLNGNDDPDEGVWKNYRSVYLMESNEADVYGQTS